MFHALEAVPNGGYSEEAAEVYVDVPTDVDVSGLEGMNPDDIYTHLESLEQQQHQQQQTQVV